MAEDSFPIIDFSQIPGCESPVGNSFRSSTSSSKLTTSNTTRSRISSIFSSNADSDDDPFDLKASARKFKAKRESKIHIGRLVDIDSPKGLTDWERLEQEATAIAGHLGHKEAPNFDELLAKSPYNSSPLCSIKEENLCPASPDQHLPRKALIFNDNFQEPMKKIANKENVSKMNDNRKEVFIDDQLERAIRKPLGNINRIMKPSPTTPSKLKPPTPTKIKPPTPSKLKPPTPSKMKPPTPSKLMKPPMTPVSSFKKTPMTSALSTRSMRTPMTPRSSVPMRPSFGTPSLKVLTPASGPMKTPSTGGLPRRPSGSFTPVVNSSRTTGPLPKRPSGSFTPLTSSSRTTGSLSRRPSGSFAPVSSSSTTTTTGGPSLRRSSVQLTSQQNALPNAPGSRPKRQSAAFTKG